MAHEPPGNIRALVGTISLDPTSSQAMAEGRHPITRIGMLKMVEGLIDQWNEEKKFGEIDVQFYPNAKLQGSRVPGLRVDAPDAAAAVPLLSHASVHRQADQFPGPPRAVGISQQRRRAVPDRRVHLHRHPAERRTHRQRLRRPQPPVSLLRPVSRLRHEARPGERPRGTSSHFGDESSRNKSSRGRTSPEARAVRPSDVP